MISRISGTLLYYFSCLVYRTCRIFVHGEENVFKALAYDGPMILTSWHGMTMMVAAFARKYLDTNTFAGIAPDDHDGRTLTVFGQKLGIKVFIMRVYGDSTFRIGRRLVDLMRYIRSGKNLIIHPDGPAGPAYKIKPGLTYIAKKTNAMILPLGCYCRHAYHVPRWDRYTLPLPFSKIHIQVGEPIQIPEGDQPLDEIRSELEDVFNRITFEAAANYYGTSRKASRSI